jgi:two-component system, chemotaxis family, protein-glutamate methylesterase/glutaminase
LVGITCPTCHQHLKMGSDTGFRCVAGHAFTPQELLSEDSRSLKEALKEALAIVEQRVTLLTDMASRYRREQNYPVSKEFEANAEKNAARARLLRRALGID